jgi:drug/metabolite transporter (DMT)-like permease
MNVLRGEAALPAKSGVFAGCLMIVGTVLCFSCMDATAKWLGTTGGVNSMQVVAVRYIGSFVVAALLLNPRKLRAHAQTRNLRLQIGRSAILVLSTTCAYVSLRWLPLTEMTTLTFAAPLIVPLLAGPFLGERVGPRRVAAIAVGFLGVLLVTRPGFHEMQWAVLLPLAGAGLNAFYSIATRKLAAYDAPETTMFYTGLVGTVATLPVLCAVWTPPECPLAWVLLGGIGGLGALAHWLLILAHKRAPASALAPFNYVQLLGATAIAGVVFGERPDGWTLSGGAVIIGTGLYVLYRERVRKREAEKAAAGAAAEAVRAETVAVEADKKSTAPL